MADIITYEIKNPPTLELDKKGKPWRYIYQVSNNVELPDYKAAQSPYYTKQNIGSEAMAKARELELFNELGGLNDVNIVGNEPQELKDLIYAYQKTIILKKFSTNPPGIQEKSYKGEKYPKEGTPKDLYNQDPIPYTFSSIVVSSTTQEPLSGVKIKDLENEKTTSNTDGSFEITGNFSPGKVQKLIFNLKNYGAKTLIITTLNGSIRSDVNIVELTPDEKDAKSGILKAQGTSDEEKKELTKEEKAELAKEIALKAIDEIKIRLIPYLITKLLCQPYGVCDPIGLIELAKELNEKAKDANERRKEKKAEKEAEKAVKEAEEGLQQ